MNIHAVTPALDCTEEEAWVIIGLYADYPHFRFRINTSPARDDSRVEYQNNSFSWQPLRSYNVEYWRDVGQRRYSNIPHDVIEQILAP